MRYLSDYGQKSCFTGLLTCRHKSSGFADNKGADQPVHPHRKIRAFVISFLTNSMSRLATSEISIF